MVGRMTQGNGMELHQGRVRLDIRRRFFNQRWPDTGTTGSPGQWFKHHCWSSGIVWTTLSGTWSDIWVALRGARSRTDPCGSLPTRDYLGFWGEQLQPHSASHKQVHSMQRVLQRLTESLLPVMVAVLMHLHTSYICILPTCPCHPFEPQLIVSALSYSASPHTARTVSDAVKLRTATSSLWISVLVASITVSMFTSGLVLCSICAFWHTSTFCLPLTYLNLLPAPMPPNTWHLCVVKCLSVTGYLILTLPVQFLVSVFVTYAQTESSLKQSPLCSLVQ